MLSGVVIDITALGEGIKVSSEVAFVYLSILESRGKLPQLQANFPATREFFCEFWTIQDLPAVSRHRQSSGLAFSAAHIEHAVLS